MKKILIDKGSEVRIGEIKEPNRNSKLIVLFLDNSFTDATGNFVAFSSGIESIDMVGGQEGSIIYP